MDPKSIANLDPKLRETYERVMGTTAPGASPSESPAPSSPSPAPDAASGLSASPSTPSAPTATPPPPDLSAPVSPEPQLSSSLSGAQPTPPASNPNIPSPSFTPYTPGNTNMPAAAQPTPAAGGDMQPLASPASVAQTTQGSSSVIKLLYIFGGVVFFIVYVFFWIKIFNYQLPF